MTLENIVKKMKETADELISRDNDAGFTIDSFANDISAMLGSLPIDVLTDFRKRHFCDKCFSDCLDCPFTDKCKKITDALNVIAGEFK